VRRCLASEVEGGLHCSASEEVVEPHCLASVVEVGSTSLALAVVEEQPT
jgi:hypothetical protein